MIAYRKAAVRGATVAHPGVLSFNGVVPIKGLLRGHALLMVSLGLALGLPAAADSASPRNGVIAYQLQEAAQTCDQCDDGESVTSAERDWVETVHPDGSRRRRLRCSSGPLSSCEDRAPAFSRDGRRLAVIGKGGLLIMRPTGRRLLRLRGVTGYSASWAPGGRRIAYTDLIRPARLSPKLTPLFGVHIADLAGRTRVLSEMDSGGVGWSATGRLAWDTNTEGTTPTGSIWVGDSTGRRRLRVLRRATRPRWSFDGRRLGFFCRGGLCASRADGSHRRLLTRACKQEPIDDVSPSGFAWSPDGSAIACSSKRGSLIVVDLRTQRIKLVRRAFKLSLDAELGAIDWQRSPTP